eukprot:CAMPEP_0197737198 /NCGR_PEP_ID=MMETSP1435-20131217/7800_1 /TAXON_ID=426625 /ORGANISM="Chaetoceros brevis, Strain CCMP164" /LENGTH=51 /DNA_ID=CAMNT_0043325643 /DNA_START=23 /DNA_END=175 /DNA_ORIENTATION=+
MATSSSTISLTSSSNDVLDSHPILFLAFVGSPNKSSTSVGRKYCGSILTRT